MKIYIVIKDSVYHEETSVEVLKATTSLEEAKSILNTQLEDARQDYAGQDNIVFDNSEMSFESYVNGEYNYNHICVSIETKELSYDLSKEYWKETILDYLNNNVENKGVSKLTDDEANKVINTAVEQLMEDDSTWNEIDSSMNYFITHHPLSILSNLKTEYDFAKVDEIAERFTGTFKQDTIGERDTLVDELEMSKEEANFIMINYLGFDEADLKEEE